MNTIKSLWGKTAANISHDLSNSHINVLEDTLLKKIHDKSFNYEYSTVIEPWHMVREWLPEFISGEASFSIRKENLELLWNKK